MSKTHLVAGIHDLDPVILLSVIGALQLIPENATHFVRLEQLAHEGCRARGTDHPNYKELLALWPTIAMGLEPMAYLEDPQESRFVEEIAFGERAYRVIPGSHKTAPSSSSTC